MLTKVMKSVFGSRNDRVLSRMDARVQVINGLENSMQALTDQALSDKTLEFKSRLATGATLDDLLPEAFAVVRETAFRTLGLRPFDVQLIGGMVLHAGNISEMRTGEGKTLVATLPAYLNALSGDGVHVVTVNDYLARRDSEWMRPIFHFLGLSVGVIYPDMPHQDKHQAYLADVVYGTNNEFGFDYLRDNMAFDLEHKVQRALNFAIVDEVDSILIDEARTPLIISGEAEDSSELYKKINAIIPSLVAQKDKDDVDGDYSMDEKQKQAYLTEHGHQTIEERLMAEGLLAKDESLYHASNILLMHHVMAALRAHVMYHCNVDYIVQQDQVMIVDEHTGRTMPGRRWSDGLHQAMEAKENVTIQNENRTLASITFQNFFRLYKKLSGMTGTADTEAYEFQQIYNLEVIVIPTNKVMRRIDQSDLIYLTQADKYQAIIEDVRACVERKQPVLVGTASIEASEVLSELLKAAKIKHQVLNAKFHEKEAQIIAEAGRPGAVTIATNMAGRGTDIVLGGKQEDEDWQHRHAEVLASGGLRIIGSERHESRRIDNQLRGRSGRQGDPGQTRFYLSLEDPLMRIFASERVSMMMRRLGMQPGEPIEHSLVTKAIENAQRKLEGHHFDVRKQLLEYDNVANEQRKVMYAQRASVLSMPDLSTSIDEMRLEVIQALVDRYLPPQTLDDQWDADGLTQLLKDEFSLDAPISEWIDQDPTLLTDPITSKLYILCQEKSDMRLHNLSPEQVTQFQRSVILENMDNYWREHLASMDHLRQGIHLRGYAQKDPKQEYKREAFTLFSMMLDDMRYEIVQRFATLTLQTEDLIEQVSLQRHADFSLQPIDIIHDNDVGSFDDEMSNVVSFARDSKKVGRNELCWCGSQEKYKNCHGKLS